MPHDRFFIDAPFHIQEELELREEARHLKVMRIQPGEEIELVNGRNQLAKARLINSQKAEILSIEEKPPRFPIILCQAIPRLNRLDSIVEKGTELGMTELWLFPGKLSEKKNVSLERAKKIMVSAMKQCGRLDLPALKITPPIAKWERLPYPAYFGDTSEAAPPFPSVIEKKEGICFVVGPEAGFAPQEEAHLKTIGAEGVRLHPLILRTDTATFAALSLISAL